MLATVGKLWLAGIPVDWKSFHRNQRGFRVPLPTYPFERERYWAEALDKNHDALEDHWPSPADETATERQLASSEADAPLNDLQAVVATIWAMALGMERVGIHEGFFELGGNSIVATRIVMTVRETLQVDLPLRSILEYSTV